MSAELLCIENHYGARSTLFKEAEKRRNTLVVRQVDLTRSHLKNATGLITTMHLDQLGMMGFSVDLEEFLNRGGRWFFNGHIMRPLVSGLALYQHIGEAGKASLSLTKLADHPVFIGIDRVDLSVRKGVAGFYGRGSNPLPKGGVAITGVGDKQAPLDWEWVRPDGGWMFSHAGNDLQSTSGSPEDSLQLSRNIISWVIAEDNK